MDRALTLLDAFADEPRLSLMALARRAGLSPATASRLLTVLEAHRLVERDAQTKQYMLGLRTLELAGLTWARFGLRGLAHPGLKRLAAETGDTVHLAVVAGDEVVYIDKLEGDEFIQVSTHVGGRSPLHCTAVGKVLLAHWPTDDLERFVARGLAKHTPRTIGEPSVLLRELLAVRQQGYAVNRGELRPQGGGLAAPVFDARNHAVAAVGLAGPVDRFAEERLPALAAAVMATARDLSVRLGWPMARHAGESNKRREVM